jgi:hypothetical protein
MSLRDWLEYGGQLVYSDIGAHAHITVSNDDSCGRFMDRR